MLMHVSTFVTAGPLVLGCRLSRAQSSCLESKSLQMRANMARETPTTGGQMVSFHGCSWSNMHGYFPSSSTVKPPSNPTILTQPQQTHNKNTSFVLSLLANWLLHFSCGGIASNGGAPGSLPWFLAWLHTLAF